VGRDEEIDLFVQGEIAARFGIELCHREVACNF